MPVLSIPKSGVAYHCALPWQRRAAGDRELGDLRVVAVGDAVGAERLGRLMGSDLMRADVMRALVGLRPGFGFVVAWPWAW